MISSYPHMAILRHFQTVVMMYCDGLANRCQPVKLRASGMIRNAAYGIDEFNNEHYNSSPQNAIGYFVLRGEVVFF
jgi:hypothetical protein